MKIGDLARRSGLSVHTLRYYEHIGLIPFADRDRSGRRDYDVSILTWIAFIGRLKATGMPISEMVRYADLRAQGATTAPERRRLLDHHRAQVARTIADFQSCLLVLDAKIAGYGDTTERINDDTDASARRKPVRPRAAGPL